MSRRTLGRELREQLAKLVALPDDQIDTTDIPETPAENWRLAKINGARPRRVDRTKPSGNP